MLLCRWSQQLGDLHEERDNLLGDCLIAASFLSYVGVFSCDLRRRMVYEDWEAHLRVREVPLSKHFSLERTLSSDIEISR
jgi:dynein heavy chain